MGQYKTIAGVRYERDLLDYADQQALLSRGPLPKSFAINLWEQAMDGNGVTETEQRTIRYIMQKYKLGEAAMAHLNEQLAQQGGKGIIKRKSTGQLSSRSGSKNFSTGYYRTIDGQRYDNGLLTQAEEMSSKGPITMAGAAQLWANAHDGKGVTECEKRTLRYIGSNFDFTTDAKHLLPQVLDAQGAHQEAISSEPSHLPTVEATRTSENPDPTRTSENPGPTSKMKALMAPVWSAIRGMFSGTSGDGAADRNSLPALQWSSSGSPSASSGTSKRKAEETHDSMDRPSKAQRTGSERCLLNSSSETADPGARESQAGMTTGLSPELRELLADTSRGTPALALECPSAPVAPADAEIQRQKAEAQKEVQRILQEKKAEDVLGTGSKARENFKRLTLLLHPDKGLVAADDDKAKLAWRLVLAARHKIPR